MQWDGGYERSAAESRNQGKPGQQVHRGSWVPALWGLSFISIFILWDYGI